MQQNSVSARPRRTASGRFSVAAAALSGVALAGASMVMVAPAQAASGPLTYSCDAGIAGAQTFSVVLDSNAPATIPVGKSITPTVTATVTVPKDLVDLITGFLGADSVQGTAEVDSVVAGVEDTIEMTVPKTKVAGGAPLDVVASGPAAPIAGTEIGQVLTLTGGDFVTNLNFTKPDGSTAIASTIPCVLNADQDAKFDTVRVVDTSATKASASYKKARKSVMASAKISTAAGTPATGKVAFVLKKGAKKIKTMRTTVKNGVAKVTFKKVTKKGKYQVLATYQGSQNVQGSKGLAKVTVR